MDKATKELINQYLKGIKAGDNECLELLYSRISANLRHIALKYLKNADDADDLVQDFWADIYKTAKGFVFSQNGFSYLCNTMTWMAINRCKKLHKESHKNSDIYVNYSAFEQGSYNEKFDQSEQNILINNAINKLSEVERIIIQLVFFEDKSTRGIARELKISKSLVSKLKIKAMDKLKHELETIFVDKSES